MVSISLSGCPLSGSSEEELPDWRVRPTAIVDTEMALEHLEWYFGLLEFPEGSFRAGSQAREITAVTKEGSRINGFTVELSQPLWEEDVTFFLVTRDKRIFYNIGGEEVRDGVPLIIRFEEGALTLAEPVEPDPEPVEPDPEPVEPDPEPDAVDDFPSQDSTPVVPADPDTTENPVVNPDAENEPQPQQTTPQQPTPQQPTPQQPAPEIPVMGGGDDYDDFEVIRGIGFMMPVARGWTADFPNHIASSPNDAVSLSVIVNHFPALTSDDIDIILNNPDVISFDDIIIDGVEGFVWEILTDDGYYSTMIHVLNDNNVFYISFGGMNFDGTYDYDIVFMLLNFKFTDERG
ncbi:MAG: hypothetical protein FWE60_01140 [Oscillospiraceae bacterium]|nr:hypothetical protein [Oscillospiraceae bacterium]